MTHQQVADSQRRNAASSAEVVQRRLTEILLPALLLHCRRRLSRSDWWTLLYTNALPWQTVAIALSVVGDAEEIGALYDPVEVVEV